MSSTAEQLSSAKYLTVKQLVFLHYVDADGPHKEWKFDKQPSLNFVD